MGGYIRWGGGGVKQDEAFYLLDEQTSTSIFLFDRTHCTLERGKYAYVSKLCWHFITIYEG